MPIGVYYWRPVSHVTSSFNCSFDLTGPIVSPRRDVSTFKTRAECLTCLTLLTQFFMSDPHLAFPSLSSCRCLLRCVKRSTIWPSRADAENNFASALKGEY